MFDEICSRIPRDSDYPDRTWILEVRKRVLEGTIYNVLSYHFHDEFNEAQEYIPLKMRRPSVRYNLSRIVVQDSVSMLFGEGRFPLVHTEDETVRTALGQLVKETHLVETMSDAAIRGSIGSVAILMRILKGRVFFDVMDTLFLTPEWDPEAPDTLLRVIEKYKVPGSSLRDMGYPVGDDEVNEDFWFQRIWDTATEAWYMPWRVRGEKEATGRGPNRIDKQRTVQHNLGFVPIAWIKNLPGGASAGGIDGACTFRPAVDTQIEMEYQLSQAGRGLKYSSDPLLMIREPAGGDNKQLVRSASSALIVSEKGDAKLLEIDGRAAAAVIEYCRALRELALESIHGNRANADKLSAAQSGRALELLHQPLVWLVDKMRTSYGEYGLLHLIGMVMKASQKVDVKIMGKKVSLATDGPITLSWGTWFPATEQDRSAQASALESHRKSGHLSRETAVRSLSQNYGIEDVTLELSKIEVDLKAEDERLIAVENAKIQGKIDVEG